MVKVPDEGFEWYALAPQHPGQEPRQKRLKAKRERDEAGIELTLGDFLESLVGGHVVGFS